MLLVTFGIKSNSNLSYSFRQLIPALLILCSIRHHHPIRNSEQIGICCFLTKSTIPIIDKYSLAFRFKPSGNLLGSIQVIAMDDDVVSVRRDTLRPNESLLISKYFRHDTHKPGYADPIASHPRSKHITVFARCFDIKSLGILLSQIKNISIF